MTDTVAESPDAASDPPTRYRHLSPLGERVSRRAYALQNAYRDDTPSAVATLARLRRAISSRPGEDPSAWAETLEVVGDDLGRADDEPSREEWAAHIALTLFAFHQQSHRDANMHRGGQSVGRAVRQLANAHGGEDEETSKPVLRRFQTLGTASSLAEVSHHARGLVAQLRADGIPPDYGQLTDDLIGLQDPRRAPSVRLSWGRAFYRTPSTGDNPTPPDGTNHSEQGDPA